MLLDFGHEFLGILHFNFKSSNILKALLNAGMALSLSLLMSFSSLDLLALPLQFIEECVLFYLMMESVRLPFNLQLMRSIRVLQV